MLSGLRSYGDNMRDIAPNHSPSRGTNGNRRSTTPRCRSGRWPSTLTARQKSASRWRASSGPPRASPSASMIAFTAPAEAPEIPSISRRPSSSNWSRTPQVNAPWAPPPCSPRLMGLRRPFRTRPGRRSRRGGVRAVITWVTRFASKIGNIHALPMRGPSTVGHPMWGWDCCNAILIMAVQQGRNTPKTGKVSSCPKLNRPGSRRRPHRRRFSRPRIMTTTSVRPTPWRWPRRCAPNAASA